MVTVLLVGVWQCGDGAGIGVVVFCVVVMVLFVAPPPPRFPSSVFHVIPWW